MTSIHQLSFVDSLKLSEITGNKPEKTVIIGIEPKEVAWGWSFRTNQAASPTSLK